MEYWVNFVGSFLVKIVQLHRLVETETHIYRGSYMSAHYISFFMKRVYYNDMTRALASVIFIIVNEFHKNDM